MLVVDLIRGVDREHLHNLDEFRQTDGDSDLPQNILELSLVDETSTCAVVKTKPVHQVVLVNKTLHHLPLYPSHEFVLPLTVHSHLLALQTAYPQNVHHALYADLRPPLANIPTQKQGVIFRQTSYHVHEALLEVIDSDRFDPFQLHYPQNL